MANNENDQDTVPDFEPETDFSEFEEEKNQSSLSAAVKNSPLIKIGLVAAGLIVVVGGVLLLSGKQDKPLTSNVGGASNLKETPGTKEVTPAMRDALEEFNDQKLEEAVNQGNSVMPVPIEPPKNFLPVPTDATNTEDPLQRWRQMQEERLRAQREQEQMQTQMNQTAQADPAVAQAQAALSQAMISQMSGILAGRTNKVSHMNVGTEPTQGVGVPGLAGVGGVGGTGQLMPQTPLEIVIPAGTIAYAQLLNEANSDVQGPVIALLAQGPFSGSRVLGNFSRTEELLVLKFTTLVSKEGFSVPINTIAMDPDTTLTGMATDVDHRYFRRVILPAAAKFVSGVGEAIAEKGTTRVTLVDGDSQSILQDNSGIDTEQELARGAQKSFDQVSEILDEEADKAQVLVVVKAGTPLGLLFMEPVTKQMIEQAKFGTSTNTIAQQQPGQMQGQPQQNQLSNQQLIGMLLNNSAQNAPVPSSVLQGLQSQQNIQNSNTQNQYMSSTSPQTP